MKRGTSFLRLFSLLFLVYLATCHAGPAKHSDDDAYLEGNDKLLQKFLNLSYNTKILPLSNNKPVVIKFSFQLINIVEVNAKKQFIKVYGWIKQTWKNPFLTWKPEDYGGLNSISVEPNSVWVPDIFLYHNLDDEDHYGGGKHSYKTDVKITSDGENSWSNPALFKTHCALNVEYFPLDDQNCSLTFGSWTQPSERLQMLPLPLEFPTRDYKNNGEWSIYDMKLCHETKQYMNDEFENVILKISMSRESFDYFIKLIVPCCLISSMIFLGFVLPPESGERIGLSITVLLAMTVFQQLTSEIMPSYGFPILGQYYFAIVLEIATSIVVTTLILNFYNRTQRKMPYVLKKLILHWMSRLIFLHDEVAMKYGAHNISPNTKGMTSEHYDNHNLNDSRQKSFRKSTRRNKRDINPGQETSDHYDAFVEMGDIFNKEQKAENDTSPNIYGMTAYPKINVGNTNKDARDNNLNIGPNMQNDISEEEKELRQWEWTLAARILDRFVLVLSILIGIITVSAVFLRAPKFWYDRNAMTIPKNISHDNCTD